MVPALKLAVFDLDGTLVDSAHMIDAAMARAFAGLSLARPAPEAVRRVVGLPLETAIARLAPELEGPVHGELAELYKDSFFAMRESGELAEALFPGVVETLDALEGDGWLLGIATSKSMRGLSATLAGFGLTGRFVTLRCVDFDAGKPAPDMLLAAMAETGAAPHETIMVGDTTYDVEMARAARVPAIGVGWGFHGAGELAAAGAAEVIAHMGALPAAAGRALVGGGAP
jgi:phosphoglycolate phosphatase